MTHARLLIAGVIVLVLLFLFGWQAHRERLVKACLEAGSAWDGRQCVPPGARPIIRRSLQHS